MTIKSLYRTAAETPNSTLRKIRNVDSEAGGLPKCFPHFIDHVRKYHDQTD
jgi:hypothetical protein